MKAHEQLLRELIRKRAQKIQKENKQADADWMVDKIATALAAATNKGKDYQYVAAFDSTEFKKIAQDIKNEKQTDEALKETFLDWLAGGASKWGKEIIDRRAGYLTQAIKNDPKLAQMARDSGMSAKSYEDTMYKLMKSDTKFLRALATQRARRW
jgi:hypothetical protein